jgi:hypothetical protein
LRDPWFPIACLLIVLLAVWVGIFGPLPNGVTAWIFKWQTLFAAALAATIASIAAYIAFTNTSRTLSHNEELERNRRLRKHAAVRALLPLALSQVVDYARRSARFLEQLVAQCQNNVLPCNVAPQSFPEKTPDETLELLSQFIEYSDTLDVSLLETTVAWIQIHDARVRTLIQENHDPNSITIVRQEQLEASIIDAASIYAGGAAFFEYARRRAHRPPTDITWENVFNALGNMQFWDQQYPGLYRIIEGRKKQSSGPFSRLTR